MEVKGIVGQAENQGKEGMSQLGEGSYLLGVWWHRKNVEEVGENKGF